ncbi:hypothetical protein PsAD46_04682 [Pseudovibrio sp. Ad46]|nr:hypothetical protein PsAD46_04682 [Pseudovibrio sp. Ad46]KZK93530.1 hypothetical protein PsAD5_03247 [Pseudovibrio sp. Ad5]
MLGSMLPSSLYVPLKLGSLLSGFGFFDFLEHAAFIYSHASRSNIFVGANSCRLTEANQTEHALKRKHDVQHLTAVFRLLGNGDLAAAAVADACLCDLGALNSVVGCNVLRTNDARYD